MIQFLSTTTKQRRNGSVKVHLRLRFHIAISQSKFTLTSYHLKSRAISIKVGCAQGSSQYLKVSKRNVKTQGEKHKVKTQCKICPVNVS